jgi:hypothetical protein
MSFPIEVIGTYARQNWLVVPAAQALGDPPPQSIHAQKWLLTLSGVALANLEGVNPDDWHRVTLLLEPSVVDPVRYAIAHHSIPAPPGTEGHDYALGFQVEQEAPYASISSVFNASKSGNSGFAVDTWRPNHYDTGIDAFSHKHAGNLFSGLQVDVAVRDTEAWLYRVGYNIALLGRIVFLAQKALFRSDFDTTVGQPPSSVQAVGTAELEQSERVEVIDAPDLTAERWVKITGPSGAEDPLAVLHCLFTESPGEGVYKLSADLFLKDHNSGIATISFETAGREQILHVDFLPHSGKARIEDVNPEFGSFPLGATFTVEVILTVKASGTTALVTLKGAASGAQEAIIEPPFQHLAPDVGAVALWQGTQAPGRISFDATNIVVTYAPPALEGPVAPGSGIATQ